MTANSALILSVVAAAVLGCGAAGGRDAAAEAPVDAGQPDRRMWPDACPSMDASGGPDVGGAADGAALDGGGRCGGEGLASVTSAFESFEARVLVVTVLTCSGRGVDIQIIEHPGGAPRGVDFFLPDPGALLGRHDGITASIALSDGYVMGTGTLEITAATDPPTGGPTLPIGHVEGRFSVQAEGCTSASGSFSGPYCQLECVQI